MSYRQPFSFPFVIKQDFSFGRSWEREGERIEFNERHSKAAGLLSWALGIYRFPTEGGGRQRQLACWSHLESPLCSKCQGRAWDGQFSMTMSSFPAWVR